MDDRVVYVIRWHGWMHHVFDETPLEAANLSEKSNYVPVTEESNAIYHTHLGYFDRSVNEKYPQYNISQFRARGYKVGSLATGPEDKDAYYKQPSHPLSEKVQQARFKVRNIESASPDCVELLTFLVLRLAVSRKRRTSSCGIPMKT